MASDIAKGTAFRGPNGQVAVRMGPTVTVGEFFVIDPDHGGYYASSEAVQDWAELDSAPPPPSTPPSPAAETSAASGKASA